MAYLMGLFGLFIPRSQRGGSEQVKVGYLLPFTVPVLNKWPQ